MIIESFLKKEKWERRLPKSKVKGSKNIFNSNIKEIMRFDDSPKQLLDQSDFLDELYPTSHSIYLPDIKSLRPKIKYDSVNKKHIFKGYHELYRTAMPIQYGIRRNKASISFSNDIWLGKEGVGKITDKMMSEIKAQYNINNVTNNILQMGYSLYGTGDAAIVTYKDAQTKKIVVNTYSYEKGDLLNYIYNPYTGEETGVRMFKFHGRKAVELWKNDVMELWIEDNDTSGELPSIYDIGFKNIITRSEDDYALVVQSKHGLKESPFVYFRERDVCWGSAQQGIEDIEHLISDILESGKLAFFPILFFNGGVMTLPELDSATKTIASKLDTGDAKFLQPPSLSTSLEFAYKKIEKSVFDTTGTVVLHPDELKGQNDSSTYLTLLYQPEIMYANQVYAEQSDSFRKFIRVFVKTVGLVKENLSDYENYELSYKLIPNIPRSEAVEADILVKYVGYGIMSKQTAIEEIERNNADELDRIKAEQI